MGKLLMIVEFIFHGTRGVVKIALRKKLQTLVFKNFLSNSQWKQANKLRGNLTQLRWA